MIRSVAEVRHREARTLAERHLPVAVEGAAGVDADGQRGDLGEASPSRRRRSRRPGTRSTAAPDRPSRRAGSHGAICRRPCVIQICWIAPVPSMSASSRVSPGAMMMYGEIFQPCRGPRAAFAAGPSVDMPPLPFSPVKFSGLIERVLARDKRERLPRCSPRPLNSVISCSVISDSEFLAAFDQLARHAAGRRHYALARALIDIDLPGVVAAFAASTHGLHVIADRLAPAL